MLSYSLLEDWKGLTLIGDYTSLALLRDIVLDVNRRSPLTKEAETGFLGLAYEARKAYEAQRNVFLPPKELTEMGVRYGAQMIWPAFLAQQRMLRLSLGYIDHSKQHQVIAYALEAVVDEALKEAFKADAKDITELLNSFGPEDLPLLWELMDQDQEFLAWSAQKRRKGLLNLLISFQARNIAIPNIQKRPQKASTCRHQK